MGKRTVAEGRGSVYVDGEIYVEGEDVPEGVTVGEHIFAATEEPAPAAEKPKRSRRGQ